MAAGSKGLVGRLGWAGFAAALAVYSAFLGVSAGAVSYFATAIAWVLFAVSWFQPPTPENARLRNTTAIAAVVLLLLSLGVRWAFKV
ncbi:MAG: hypothetical protein QM702_09265 [Rubrivivax sp.]